MSSFSKLCKLTYNRFFTLAPSNLRNGNSPTLSLPYYRWTGKAPGAVFFPGIIDYPWNGPFASDLLNHLTNKRGKGFFRFQNRFYDENDRKYDLQMCFEDSEVVLSFLDATEPEQKRVLIGCGAGALIALNLAQKYPEKIHRLVLFSPWFHFKLESLNKILPRATDALFQGQNVLIPESTGTNQGVFIDQKAWFDLANLSVTLGQGKKFSFPITILHGTADRIIPIERMISFVDQFDAPEVDVMALENQGHVYNLTPEVLEIVDKVFGERNQEDGDRGRVNVTSVRFQSEASEKVLEYYRNNSFGLKVMTQM